MNRPKPPPHYFIISAFDNDLRCSVLESRFEVMDLKTVQTALGPQADNDNGLEHGYFLDNEELTALTRALNVSFDPKLLKQHDLTFILHRLHSIRTAPYLIHTGYELFLLLEDRKKIACMGDSYPPTQFDGEERFDHWVSQGVLHKEEFVEPFEHPRRKWLGIRTVYYTLKGEEWRISAMKLIWDAASKSGGWNEYFERLQGMLFGYEDWQNDWWIEHGLRRGGFGGARLCCAVNAEGLAWIEASGFRALPPIDEPNLVVTFYDIDDEAGMRAFMLSLENSVALVCFNVFFNAINKQLDIKNGPPWHIPCGKIPDLNRNLRRMVQVVAQREGS